MTTQLPKYVLEQIGEIENYLISNVDELALILEELQKESIQELGYTVHQNEEEFYDETFKNDPFGALLAANNNQFDINDSFVLYLPHENMLYTFNSDCALPTLDTDIHEIAKMIIRLNESHFINAMSNDLYQLITNLSDECLLYIKQEHAEKKK